MLTTSALLFFFDFVHAGGPTGQSIRFRRDNQLYPIAATGSALASSFNQDTADTSSLQEYVAISTSPDGSGVQCLTSYGSSMVVLEACDKLDLTNPGRLFTFIPVEAYLKKKLIKGSNYALRSEDGKCVDFTPTANKMFFKLADCGSITNPPWFHDWAAMSQRVGNFPPSNYSVISSPAAGFDKTIKKSKCFYANNQGGIDIDSCKDEQKFTWFAHSTFKAPRISQVNQENEATCSSNPLKCDATTKDTTIFRPNSDKVAKDIKPLSGIFLPNNYAITFSIRPRKTVDAFTNFLAFKMGNFSDAASAFSVSFLPKSTQLKITVGSASNTNAHIVLRNQLPLGIKSDISVVVFGFKLMVFVNGQLDSFTTISSSYSGPTYFYNSDPWYTPADGYIGPIKVLRLKVPIDVIPTPITGFNSPKISKQSLPFSSSLKMVSKYSIKFDFSPLTKNKNILRITDDGSEPYDINTGDDSELSEPYDINIPSLDYTNAKKISIKVSTEANPEGVDFTSSRILELQSTNQVQVKFDGAYVELIINENSERFTLNSPLYQDPDGEAFLVISNQQAVGNVTVQAL